MEVRDVLLAAKALVNEESHLSRRFCAEDRFGIEVPVYSQNAVSFCIIGAIEKAGGEDYDIKRDAREAFRDVIGGDRSIALCNKSASHPEIMAVFDRAIGVTA